MAIDGAAFRLKLTKPSPFVFVCVSERLAGKNGGQWRFPKIATGKWMRLRESKCKVETRLAPAESNRGIDG
jgi:hypothetical protein